MYYVHVNNFTEGETMARPKKADSEKRENRLTVYLTDEERDTLTGVADREGRPMPRWSCWPSRSGCSVSWTHRRR